MHYWQYMTLVQNDFSSFQLIVPTQIPEKSPHHKMKRVNTPSKTVKIQLFSEVTPVVDDDSLDMHHYDGPKFVHTDEMKLNYRA